MGKRFSLRGLLSGRRDGAPVSKVTAQQEAHSIDTALIIGAARLAVTTRAATKALFVRHLGVTGDVAERLLLKLEHCEVVSSEQPGRPRRVLTTSAQLPGVVAEFERRG